MKDRFALRITALCIVALFLFVPASKTFGQDDASSVGAGSKAMLFTFSGLSVLGANAFDGGFGGKYFLTDAWALRAALRFATAFQSVNYPLTVPVGLSVKAGSQSGTRLGLTGDLEYHFLKSRVSPYAGGGLGITYTFTKSRTPEVGSPPPDPTITDNLRTGETINGNTFIGGTAFNIGLIGGVEFFITKEVSLGAEYQFGYTLNARNKEKITSTTGSTTNTQTTSFPSAHFIGISSVGSLALAIYF
jgi:opacity protein-like surface antigen